MVTMHGTGFDPALWPGNLAILAFAGWMIFGGRMSDRTKGGVNLVFVLILGLMFFGLFGGTSHGAEPGVVVSAVDGRTLPPWHGIDLVGLFILGLLYLAFFHEPPKGDPEKKKPESKPAPKPESDPRLALVASLFDPSTKKSLLIPLLLFPLLSVATTADASRFADAFTPSDRIAQAEAARARALAELERTRTENAIRIEQTRADIERQTALLRSAGYRPESDDTLVFAAGFAMALCVLALFLYWLENRWRVSRENEVRELQMRLALMEQRPRPVTVFRPERRMLEASKR